MVTVWPLICCCICHCVRVGQSHACIIYWRRVQHISSTRSSVVLVYIFVYVYGCVFVAVCLCVCMCVRFNARNLAEKVPHSIYIADHDVPLIWHLRKSRRVDAFQTAHGSALVTWSSCHRPIWNGLVQLTCERTRSGADAKNDFVCSDVCAFVRCWCAGIRWDNNDFICPYMSPFPVLDWNKTHTTSWAGGRRADGVWNDRIIVINGM